jgi:hypothetical protein
MKESTDKSVFLARMSAGTEDLKMRLDDASVLQ